MCICFQRGFSRVFSWYVGWCKLAICSMLSTVSLAEDLLDLPEAWCTLAFNSGSSDYAYNCLGPWWINQPDGWQSRNIVLSMDCVVLLNFSSLMKGREMSTDERLMLDSPNCSTMQQKKECYPWGYMFKYWDCVSLHCKIKQVQYQELPMGILKWSCQGWPISYIQHSYLRSTGINFKQVLWNRKWDLWSKTTNDNCKLSAL